MARCTVHDIVLSTKRLVMRPGVDAGTPPGADAAGHPSDLDAGNPPAVDAGDPADVEAGVPRGADAGVDAKENSSDLHAASRGCDCDMASRSRGGAQSCA